MDLSFKIASNSLYQLLSRLLSAGSIFLVTLLITRNLSKEVWGDFIIITSYIGIFTIISDYGLNAIFVKKIAKNSQKIDEYFHNLLGLRVVLSLIAAFLALAVLVFLPYSGSVKIGIIVGISIIILQSIFNTSTAIFQQKLRYESFALSDIFGSLVIVFLTFLAVYFEAGLLSIIFVFIVGNFVKAAVSLLLASRLVSKLGLKFDFSVWRLMLFASLPLGLMLFFSQINANIDKQIIALTDLTKFGVSSTVAAGLYGLSYRIFDLVISLATFVGNSIFPIFLDSHQEDREGFATLAKKAIVAVFAVGLVISLAGWVLAPIFLEIFGEYSLSLPSLRILLSGVPFFFVTSLLLWIVVTLNKEIFLPFIYGFAALGNLVLNMFFIPIFGFNAAAWVTVLTELLILFLLSLLLVNTRKTNET